MLAAARGLRAGAAVLMFGAALAVLVGVPVRGAEQSRARPAGQTTPPRDRAVPRTPSDPVEQQPTLTAERAEAFVDAARRGLDYLPGEVLVRFKPFVSSAARQRALDVLGGRPRLGDVEWHGPVALVRDRTEPNAHVLAHRLRERPEVAYAEPNHIARVEPRLHERLRAVDPSPAPALAAAVPNDEDFAAYQWNFSLIDMPGAWEIQPGGRPEIVVAVLDTGVTAASVTRTFRIWTGAAFEDVPMPFAVSDDLPAARLVGARDLAFLEPSGPVLDLDGHGTHVAGTIGESTNNLRRLAGMAYNVRVMPIKVCLGYWEILIARAQASITGFPPADVGGCLYSDMADGIYYAADQGARVMNISIGGPGASTLLRDALTYAASRGMFVAISMGNDFQNGNTVSFPARYGQDIQGVMAVGAVGKTSDKAYYSSTGPHCEIAAPGGDGTIGGSPDFGFVWQTTLDFLDQVPSVIRPRFDRYDKIGYQGTSMAAPHVAGLAALLASQSPGMSPASIERIVRATARDLGAPGRDDFFGYGLIQPRTALFGRGIRR